MGGLRRFHSRHSHCLLQEENRFQAESDRSARNVRPAMETYSLSKKILVVDDDPDIREILRDRLNFFGYVVETAMDGREAIDVLRRSRFDGMLLDLRMPEIDGMEVLRRTHENHPALPVVMISALSVPERAAQAVAQGACAYLIKPFDPVQLRQVTERFFGASA